MSWFSLRWFVNGKVRPSRPRARLQVEILEDRVLLNNRFVVPAGTTVDNVTNFATLQAALTTSGLASGNVIQIEPGSSPGNVSGVNLPDLPLTIQGDPAGGRINIPQFTISDATSLDISQAGQAGFTLKNLNIGLIDSGQIIFGVSGTITNCNIVGLSALSNTTAMVSLNGAPDTLTSSTITNQASVGYLVQVTGSANSKNLISANTFVANAAITANLLSETASSAVTVSDKVYGNTFLASTGTTNTASPTDEDAMLAVSDNVSGLTIQNNTFSDQDQGEEGIDLQGGTQNVVEGNQFTFNPLLSGVLAAPTQSTPSLASGGSLALNTTYYWVITAVNAKGQSIESNEESLTPTTSGTQTADLSWAQVPNATGYDVYRSTTSGTFADSLVTTISSGSTTTYDDTGTFGAPTQNTPTLGTGGNLTAGTPYYWVITATNAEGQSLASNQETLTPTAGNLTADLSWTQVTGATGYNIYRSTTSGTFASPALVTTISSGSTTTYDDTGTATTAGAPPTGSPPDRQVGIAVTPGSVGFTGTVSATISGNILSVLQGTGLLFQINTGTMSATVQGNSFQNNTIGVHIVGTGSAAGIDLGGGSSPSSLGGNNFRSFTSQGTGTTGAIVTLSGTTGIISANQNIFGLATPLTACSLGGATISNTITTLGLNNAYVEALYIDFLHRPGSFSVSGQDASYWANGLNSGTMTLAQVANGIVRSTESLTDQVDALYLKILGRQADSSGQTYFVGLLQNGGTLEEVETDMFASPEYAADTGSAGPFIQSLYNKLLGRIGSSSEVQGWVNALPSMGRAAVVAAFLNSPEFRGDAVEQLYGNPLAQIATTESALPNLLHRPVPASSGEVSGWVNSGLDLLSLQAAIASSGEFYNKG